MKKPTKAQREHMARTVEIGCVACLKRGYGKSPAEIHHARWTGQGRDHDKVIPLCPIHHRHGGFDHGRHCDPAEFEKDFGSDQELLNEVNMTVNFLTPR